MSTDEIKGVVRFFYILGFPAGVIALAGCLSFALGVWREDIALTNKRIVFGCALFSLAVALYRLPRIVGSYQDEFNKRRWVFSFKDFVGAVIYGAAAYVSWHWLWRLLH